MRRSWLEFLLPGVTLVLVAATVSHVATRWMFPDMPAVRSMEVSEGMRCETFGWPGPGRIVEIARYTTIGVDPNQWSISAWFRREKDHLDYTLFDEDTNGETESGWLTLGTRPNIDFEYQFFDLNKDGARDSRFLTLGTEAGQRTGFRYEDRNLDGKLESMTDLAAKQDYVLLGDTWQPVVGPAQLEDTDDRARSCSVSVEGRRVDAVLKNGEWRLREPRADETGEPAAQEPPRQDSSSDAESSSH